MSFVVGFQQKTFPTGEVRKVFTNTSMRNRPHLSLPTKIRMTFTTMIIALCRYDNMRLIVCCGCKDKTKHRLRQINSKKNDIFSLFCYLFNGLDPRVPPGGCPHVASCPGLLASGPSFLLRIHTSAPAYPYFLTCLSILPHLLIHTSSLAFVFYKLRLSL